MIEYLHGAPLELPTAVIDAPTPLGPGYGSVTPSFETGELLLVNADGKAFRLSWHGEPGAAGDRSRSIPAGEYALRTYRIVREKDGEPWHVSATKPTIRNVRVRAGENVVVELDDAIRIRARRHGGQAQMSIQGVEEAGLSIYRSGKRIPIDYRIVGEGGAQVAEGHMRYG